MLCIASALPSAAHQRAIGPSGEASATSIYGLQKELQQLEL